MNNLKIVIQKTYVDFEGLLNETFQAKKQAPQQLNQTQPSFNTTALHQNDQKSTFLTEKLDLLRYRGSL